MINRKKKFIDELRARAYDKLRVYVGLARKRDTPIETLAAYPWLIPTDTTITQSDFRRLNAEFDQKSCFGRFVLSVLIVEKLFPGVKIEAGEVMQDFCGDIIRRKLEHETDLVIRREMAIEFLMYEEPHAVIVVDGEQFDPISTVVQPGLTHPQINVVPAWDLILASTVVDEALECNNSNAKNIHLQRAEVFCPDSDLVQQNLASSNLELGEYDAAKREADKLLRRRNNARVLFAFAEPGNEYDSRLKQDYPAEVVQLLEEELQALMGGVA